MTNGETIFVTFVSNDHAKVWVTEYLVLDAENKIVKCVARGDVRVLADWESVHPTEADAWQRAAQEIAAFASNLRIRADECLKKAAAARIVRVPA